MAVSHITIRSETVSTEYGPIELDSEGRVVALHDLLVAPNKILALPGFIDTEVYTGGATKSEIRNKDKDLAEEKYKRLILTLERDYPDNINVDGYLDLPFFNEHAVEQGLEKLKGLKRQKLSEIARSQSAFLLREEDNSDGKTIP
jgi:hypothetical protein